MSVICHIDTSKPDSGSVSVVARALDEGKMIVYPTETVYGLGVDCMNEEAIRKCLS